MDYDNDISDHDMVLWISGHQYGREDHLDTSPIPIICLTRLPWPKP